MVHSNSMMSGGFQHLRAGIQLNPISIFGFLSSTLLFSSLLLLFFNDLLLLLIFLLLFTLFNQVFEVFFVLFQAVHELFDLILPLLYKKLLLSNQLINTLLILEQLIVLAVGINVVGGRWLDGRVLQDWHDWWQVVRILLLESLNGIGRRPCPNNLDLRKSVG